MSNYKKEKTSLKSTFLKSVANCEVTTKRLDELEINEKYPITKFECTKGEYGSIVRVKINDDYFVNLPNRYSKTISINQGNQVLADGDELFLIYKGKRIYKKVISKDEVDEIEIDDIKIE